MKNLLMLMPLCVAAIKTLFPVRPIQEAQEMREDDDLKRATELSLQGVNKVFFTIMA